MITAAERPVSVEEAMRQCRITIDRDDEGNALDQVALDEVAALLQGYIDAAVYHLNGWTGILGACIGEQTWRQDFDTFERCLRLPLGPVVSVASVTFRNDDGQISTIANAEYSLQTDAAGDSIVRFRNAYSFPPDALYETGAVSVLYKAGLNPIPAPIKQAILLMVGAWYENREEVIVGTITASLPSAVAVDRLISPFRRMVI